MARPGGAVSAGLADLGTTGWGGDDDDDPAAAAPTADLRQQQRQLIREQDEGLDVLASVISRQRQMAGTIGVEIEEQSALIDNIADMADRSAGRMERQTHQVRLVDRKASRTCLYWVVILLLLVAIVVIFLW